MAELIKRMGGLTYLDPIDRPTQLLIVTCRIDKDKKCSYYYSDILVNHLKFLRVTFEYVQKKRKKSGRERGIMDANYIQKKFFP